jgi:hypothetical protein
MSMVTLRRQGMSARDANLSVAPHASINARVICGNARTMVVVESGIAALC